MDCEKFDSLVLDELYDELDEVTHAAMRRHGESCSRCAGALSDLRTTREVGILPMVEPSAGFEERVLEAACRAQRTAWPRQLMRAMTWAGSHAMRPQLAMAAVFMLIIGSSLLLLRAKPGTPAATPVRVTERGEPTPEVAAEPPPPAALAPAPLAAPAPPATSDREQRDDRKDAKTRGAPSALDEGMGAAARAEAEKDALEASAALAEARSVRASAGCSVAVDKFDAVGARYAGTPMAADAMWEAANCYRSMGNDDKARELYTALRDGAYKEKAEQALASFESAQATNAAPGGGQRAGAAAPMKAAARPSSPPAAAKPASPSPGQKGGGSAEKTPAAPPAGPSSR